MAFGRSTYRCEILTSFADVQKIARDWHALHGRVDEGVFGDFEDFEIWWRLFGQNEKAQLLVALARDKDGVLRAVLPLSVFRRGLLRTARQAGHDLFCFGDILSENEESAEALFRHLQRYGVFDLAAIKDIRSNAFAWRPFLSAMFLRKKHSNFYLDLTHASGEEWLAAQSSKMRKELRRKRKKMEGLGCVAFHILPEGAAVPEPVLEALYAHKRNWVETRHEKQDNCYTDEGMKTYLGELIGKLSREGILYLAWVTCGDAVAACHLGFYKKNVLNLYITSFNAEFSAFSPGNLMMAETIMAATDKKLRKVDFLRGDEDYKQHFANRHKLLSDFIGGRSLLGKFVVWVFKTFYID